MKRTVLVMLIVISSIILSACTRNTETNSIEFDSYDFTNLENCIAVLVDQDEETVCTVEDARVYTEDYANYLLPYFLDNTEAVEIEAYMHYFEGLSVTLRFNGLPTSLQSDILIMNQIISKVNTDIDNVTNNVGYDMIDFPQIFFRGESLTDDLSGASFVYSATMNNDDYFTNYRMITDDAVEDVLNVGLARLENILDLSETTLSALMIENLEGGRIAIVMKHTDLTFNINSLASADVDTLRPIVESRFPNYTYTDELSSN